jgi:hypothetical protein
MSTPTDADRAKAAELACCPDCWQTPLTQVDAIAAAIAEARATERAAADQLRADVEKAIQELDGWQDNAKRYAETVVVGTGAAKAEGRQRAYERATARLRAILDAR